MRPIALMVVVVLAVAGCGARSDNGVDPLEGAGVERPVPHATILSHPPPSRSPSPIVSEAPPVCVGGLSVRAGEMNAAMGLRALPIELVNCGSGPYRIKGSPTVRLLDADRVPFDIAVNPEGATAQLPERYAAPPKELVLQPGDAAVAMLLWRNTLTDYTTATQATYLDVVPAPGLPAQTVTRWSPYDLGNTGRLTVSPWVR